MEVLRGTASGRPGLQSSGVRESAPRARSAPTICSSRRMMATCSAEKPAAAAFGSPPCLEQTPVNLPVAGVRGQNRTRPRPRHPRRRALAPAATSCFADARSPPRAANSSAVSPPCGIDRLYWGRPCGGTAITWFQTSDRAWTSAPWASSPFTTSGVSLRRPPTSAPSVRARHAHSRSRLWRAAVRRRRDCQSEEATITGVSPSRSSGSSHSHRLAAAPANHGRAAVQAGRPERRGAKVVGRVNPGACANQEIGALEIVAVAGPMESGRAVRLGGVHVCFFLDERRGRCLCQRSWLPRSVAEDHSPLLCPIRRAPVRIERR